MNIKTLVVSIVRANCYLVWNDLACVLIDPGDDAERIETALQQLGKPLKAILLTHGHFDHVGAVKALKERYPQVPVMIGALNEELLLEPERVYKGMLSRIPDSLHLKADRLLSDGDEINVNGMHFTVIATPGHTKGGCCYYSEEDKVVFCGDTLFMESIGRTDFPTGNGRELIDSLKNRLLVLPGDVTAYPGHGPETTIDYEQANNPYA